MQAYQAPAAAAPAAAALATPLSNGHSYAAYGSYGAAAPAASPAPAPAAAAATAKVRLSFSSRCLRVGSALVVHKQPTAADHMQQCSERCGLHPPWAHSAFPEGCMQTSRSDCAYCCAQADLRDPLAGLDIRKLNAEYIQRHQAALLGNLLG